MRLRVCHFREGEDEYGVEEGSAGKGVVELRVLVLEEEENQPEDGSHPEQHLLFQKSVALAQLLNYCQVLLVDPEGDSQVLGLRLQPKRRFPPSLNQLGENGQVLLFGERSQVAHDTFESDPRACPAGKGDIVNDYSFAGNGSGSHELVLL